MSKTFKLKDYLPDTAIPPGVTLIELLESLGMPQTELAKRMGRPVKTINEIIKGKTVITAETAIQLERVLGISSQFWSNLEMIYQTSLARLKSKDELEKQVKYIERYPYAEMVKWGWVKRTQNKVERVNELLNFFGVTLIQSITLDYKTCYRAAFRHMPSNESLAVWLRQGERLAAGISTKSYQAPGFQEALNSIRSLTINLEKGFAKKLTQIFSQYGVAVVYVPHLERTYVNGATRWLSPDKALIQLSIRNRYEDIFWFTYFHEAAHILLHGKRERFIDFDDLNTSDQEIEADRFAANILIPPEKYGEFIDRADLSSNAVIAFADDLGVSPGIVVGRLQHDGYIPHSKFNRLRRQLRWCDD